MFLKLVAYADSGVFYHELIVCGAILAGKFTYLNQYRAAGLVILDSIVDDVGQDLYHLKGITDQPAVMQLRFLQRQMDTGRLRVGRHDGDAVL